MRESILLYPSIPLHIYEKFVFPQTIPSDQPKLSSAFMGQSAPIMSILCLDLVVISDFPTSLPATKLEPPMKFLIISKIIENGL